MSTDNLCFEAEIKKIKYLTTSHFHYIKVGYQLSGVIFHGHVFLMLCCEAVQSASQE